MRLLGSKGENLAAAFLKKKGYKILSRNYKTPFGEIDIVAKDGETLVFVEVKTRADKSFGEPFEAVNCRKREKLRKVALSYLKNCCKNDLPSRFDVMSIQAGDKNEVEHIIDAFE
jgi:putative endonuclease